MLSRVLPDLPVRPGIPPATRGASTFATVPNAGSANFDVVKGEVFSPTIGEQRTEIDFAEHLRRTLARDDTVNRWHVVHGLNTDQSEALVRLVVELEGLDIELGVKGKCGILQSMPTRTA